MVYLVLIFCLCLVTPIYAESRPGYPTIGVNTHFLRYPHNYQVNKMLKMVGVKYVRDDFPWQQAEKVKGRFAITPRMVEYIDNLNKFKVKPIMVLCFSNSNYSPSKLEKAGPDSQEMIKGFSDYVAFMVSKFKGKVYAWEIWNEPDHRGFWRPAPNSRDYSLLVKNVAPIIRKIDPGAVIVAGALSKPDWEFLDSLQKDNALADVDVISFHWYTFPRPPDQGGGPMTLPSVRAFIQGIKSLGKRAWITEMGYATSTDKMGVSEALQAEYMKKQFELAGKMGVEVCVFYDLIDDGLNPGNYGHRHGLFRTDGTPKPAALALPIN